MIALKTALNMEAEIVMLQEPLISNQKLSYCTFNFYCPKRDRIVTEVMTAIRKDLFSKINMEYRTDEINHLYFIFLEI